MEISHFYYDLLDMEYASPNIDSLDYIVGGLVAKSCMTLANPWTVAHKVPLSMGFPRQEYWSGLPFPSPKPRICVNF